MMMLVEIGNQRTELVDKTIDLIARKFSEIFDRLAPRARSAAVSGVWGRY
jgi:chromosome segregation ATPase